MDHSMNLIQLLPIMQPIPPKIIRNRRQRDNFMSYSADRRTKAKQYP